MSGDINLKINKKLGLGIIGALSIFAMADFVSVIDSKSSGGIVVMSSATSTEIENAVNDAIADIMPIGSVVFRMDNINPSIIYGGTWTLLDDDAAVRLGDGSAQTGIATGLNVIDTPLKPHAHVMNHDHPSVTSASDTHDHQFHVGQSGTGNAGRIGWNIGGPYYSVNSLSQLSSNTHSHSVDLPNYIGDTGSTGDDSTVDLRGRYVTLNVWQRTS